MVATHPKLTENQKIVLVAVRDFGHPASVFDVALRVRFTDLIPMANRPESGEWDRHFGRVNTCLLALRRKGILGSKKHFKQGPLYFILKFREEQLSLLDD